MVAEMRFTTGMLWALHVPGGSILMLRPGIWYGVKTRGKTALFLVQFKRTYKMGDFGFLVAVWVHRLMTTSPTVVLSACMARDIVPFMEIGPRLMTLSSVNFIYLKGRLPLVCRHNCAGN